MLSYYRVGMRVKSLLPEPVKIPVRSDVQLPQVGGITDVGAMDVTTKIVKLRERLDLTQEELEVKAGLPRGRVAKWESGQGEPMARHLTGLARALGVSVDWLCDPAAPDEPEAAVERGPSEAERVILALAHVIGLEEAARRLSAAPPDGQSHRVGKPVDTGRVSPEAKARPGRRCG